MPLLGATGGGSAKGFGALANLGYFIRNSLRFRASASAYLSRTPASVGNTSTWTWSAWVKRGTLSSEGILISAGVGATGRTLIYINSTDNIVVSAIDSSVTRTNLVTSAVYRDPSAWYHIVVAYDETNGTSTNRVKLYVNGSQVTAFSSSTYPPGSAGTYINFTSAHAISRNPYTAASYFDGYMTEVNLIDGQALTPSSFGKTDTTTGVWKPKAYTGTYGTNGFYLKFSDIATTSGSNAGLGKDFSGNANYWTTNNISVTAGTTYDAMTDVPTNTSATVANYCVMNPLQRTVGGAAPTSANLKWAAGIADWYTCFATIGVSSGKYYWEVTNTNLTSSSTYTTIGISKAVTVNAVGTNIGSDADSYVYYSQNGNKLNNGSQVAYGAAYVSNDIVGVALDLDNGKLFFSKNGTWQASGDPAAGTNAAYTGLSGTFQPAISELNSTIDINFGQRPFVYTPPTGFNSVNTYNLPDSTIKKGNSYMDATLWTGTGATLSITNAGAFKPDLVWAKTRSTVSSNLLYDSIRGVNQYLSSNQTAAEATLANSLTAFNSNGFTVGSDSNINGSGVTNVAWQWQAGQGTNTTNTSGSITSTVSVNTTAGFSVVTYTGTGANATVGHGLGVAPKMFIVKNRVQGTYGNWNVWHTALSGSQYLTLNATDAAGTNNNRWNGTVPTSTVFSLGADSFGNTNKSGDTYVAYCFAEVEGYSKFGSYTGNGSADGPFIFLGFRPKFVMIKRTDGGTNNWVIFDSSRNTYNATGKELKANTNAAEYDGDTTNPNDFLSNGLKIRHDGTAMNISSGTYIYMAFAEAPFKYSSAR